MSEPFAFLEEDEEETEKSGIAWLPLSLATIALGGFLAIPLLGLFNTTTGKTDWSQYTTQEPAGISVSGQQPARPDLDTLEPLPTPDPETLTENLISVDETLASLGEDYVPPTETEKQPTKKRLARGIEVQASETVKGNSKRSPKKKITILDTSRIASNEGKSETSKRLPRVERPVQKAVASKAGDNPNEVIVEPGDTLYSISRKTGLTPHELAKLNGTDVKTPIRVGQKLRISNDQNAARRSPDKTIRPVSPPVSAYANDLPKIGEGAAIRPLSPGHAYTPGSYFSPEDGPNPLDRYENAVAYRVQRHDNLESIANALATTPKELIEINGRTHFNKGEMLIVPVDNCMVKD